MGAEFIQQCKHRGTVFGRTLTIGRQLLFLSPRQIKKLLRTGRPGNGGKQGIGADVAWPFPAFAERLLTAMGATSVDSLDYAAYEGATVLHDLNQPLPEELKDQWDTVIDSGTIEHVFDFPQAMRTYMELVKPGGSLILMTTANNFFGHGFYQFSAELFFRIFTRENGFDLKRIEVGEDEMLVGKLLGGWGYHVNLRGRVREVSDPADVGSRVELVNNHGTVIMVHAIKRESVPLFRSTPMQSDYVATWTRTTNSEKPRADAPSVVSRASLATFAPRRWLLWAYWEVLPRIFGIIYGLLPHGWFGGKHLNNRRFYRPRG